MVDLKSGFIRSSPENTKTDEDRAIPLNKELTELFKNTIKCIYHDFMFTNRNKLIKSIREIFAKVCKEEGVEDFTLHDFRHDFITRKRREGHDPIKIMKDTGHKTISMYLSYNTVTEEELKTLNSGWMDTKMDTNQNHSTGTTT